MKLKPALILPPYYAQRVHRRLPRILPARGLAWQFGLLAFGLMLGYFLIINALGWQRSEAVRFGSNAFVVLAVWLAIRAYKAETPGLVPYLGGLGLGLQVSLIGSVLFALFLFAYIYEGPGGFTTEMHYGLYFQVTLSPFMLAASVILLGVVSGSLTSYILMMSNKPNITVHNGESTSN